jgi:general secretion pathway protein D
VGNQVPVKTSETVTSGGNTVESIEFKDTGVLLTVRPQVNAGGLVTMELNQEVTNVGEIDDATGQRSFLQRTINSKVAIQSGKTIVLGGLILESDSTGKSGIPILHKLPVLGPLFGSTTNEFGRTELIVLITPRVIDSSGEAEKVTSELRRRMQQTVPMTEEVFRPSAMRF